MDNFKQQEIDDEQRRRAADRLMIHLLQKGRHAPYKERLIDVLANPDRGRMPEALIPITDRGPLGIAQQLVFAIESWIRGDAKIERQQLLSGSHQSKI